MDQSGEWQLALGKDHLFAQCFNVWPYIGSKFPVARLCPELQTLGDCARKALAGITKNLPIQASWMIYVLSNIRRIKSVIPTPVLPVKSDNSAEDGPAPSGTSSATP
eukprot:1035233-Pyramimonas_sp.AAC.1